MFGAVNLILKTAPRKHKSSDYDIGSDARASFSSKGGSRFGENLITFAADMSSLVHIDNKKKYTFILAKDPADASDDTTLTAEKENSIMFF